MNPSVVEKTKQQAVRALHPIKADASGAMPSRIQLVPAGKWVNSIKGDIEITVADLNEMKANFDAGIGLPGDGSEGAPIDFAHEDWDKAGAWIKAVEVIDGILYATEIEWTAAGTQAITSREFKFISPSFYPACRGDWYDPEDPTISAQNVLVGAGFTNIPFFKGLTGLKASSTTASAGEIDSTIFINNAETKGEKMNFDTAKAMTPAEVAANEEAKKVLADNKDKLTAAELVAFGLEEAEKKPEVKKVEATAFSEEDAKLLASVKSGEMKLVQASEYDGLKGKVEASEKQLAEIRAKEVAEVVKAHVARGAIKPDQSDKWVARILADATVQEDLEALPENKLIASEIGKSNGEATSAVEKTNDLIAEKVKASVVDGKPALSVGDATSLVRKEDPELAKAYDAEIKENNGQ